MGNNITLMSDTASIGSGTIPFAIETAHSGTGNLTSSSYGNTYVVETSGNLSLGTVQTTQGTAFISAPGGEILNGLKTGTNITSGKTYLFANGDIGTQTNEITSATPSSTTVADLQADSTNGSIYISNTGSLNITGVQDPSDPGIVLKGSLDLTTHCTLTVSQNIVSTSGDINLTAGNGDDLVVDAGVTVEAEAGNVSIQAGDDLTIQVGAVVKSDSGSVTLSGDQANPAGVGANILISGAIEGNTIFINGGPNGDTITLTEITALSGTTYINGGAGDDTITVDQLPTIASAAQNTVNIDGGAGNNTVNVDYSGSSNYVINVTDASQTPTPTPLTSQGGSSQVLLSVGTEESFDATNDVSLSDSSITIKNNGYTTGEAVSYAGNTSGTVGGLNNGQVYYVISTGANTIQLAQTYQDALNKNAVSFTGLGSGTNYMTAVPQFDAAAAVDVTKSTISLNTASLFTGEMVRYDNGGQASANVGGLNNGQVYYVIVEGPNTLQLASSLEDAMKTAPVAVALTGTGIGQNTFDPVVGAKSFGSAQVNTTDNTITIDDHGYLNGEAIVYNGGTTPIVGLTNGTLYYVIVVDANTIQLSATRPTSSTTLNITGTNQNENFLLRASTESTGYAFVASLNSGTNVERVNYTGSINNLVVNTGNGNDTVTIDDNRAETLINAGSGTDTFQVGQIFQSARDAADAQIAPDDAFTTTLTTRGYLSNGVSFDTTIVGGSGADNFTVFHNVANLNLVGGSALNNFSIQAFASESSSRASTRASTPTT